MPSLTNYVISQLSLALNGLIKPKTSPRRVDRRILHLVALPIRMLAAKTIEQDLEVLDRFKYPLG